MGRVPDFLYAAPDTTARAAFSRESRMNFVNATKIHRTSGMSRISCTLRRRRPRVRLSVGKAA